MVLLSFQLKPYTDYAQKMQVIRWLFISITKCPFALLPPNSTSLNSIRIQTKSVGLPWCKNTGKFSFVSLARVSVGLLIQLFLLLFPLCYVILEFHKFLHQGSAKSVSRIDPKLKIVQTQKLYYGRYTRMTATSKRTSPKNKFALLQWHRIYSNTFCM